MVCGSCEQRFRRVAAGRVARDHQGAALSIRAAYELEPSIRTLIAAFKYRRERRLSRWAASQLVALVPRGADAIAWVPATPRRARQRGFDQAGEMAHDLAAMTGVPSMRLVRRADSDRRQTEQARDERQAGPALHAVQTKAAAGLVVLIDDVVTTGASLGVASALLIESGVGRVVPTVLAATPLRSSWSERS